MDNRRSTSLSLNDRNRNRFGLRTSGHYGSHQGPPKYLRDSVDIIFQAMASALRGKVYAGFKLLRELAEGTANNPYQAVEMYPRMPWHDIHGCIAGSAAGDLASHFVQVEKAMCLISNILPLQCSYILVYVNSEVEPSQISERFFGIPSA